MLAHAAGNFEKKPGQVYHLYERNGKHQWSMLSLDDYRGKVSTNSENDLFTVIQAPAGSKFMGSYKFETDRTFTKIGTKSEERMELENFVNEMLSNPHKAIGFGPTFSH